MEEGQRAYLFALRALTRRDHGEAELKRKMADKGFSAAEIADVVDRMKGAGYLDDRRFALRWAESAVRNGKGYGYRLRFELSRRGIPDDVVAEVMADITAEHDEHELVRELISRKFPGYNDEEADERLKRRVVGYLQRRGFSPTAIWRALGDLEGE